MKFETKVTLEDEFNKVVIEGASHEANDVAFYCFRAMVALGYSARTVAEEFENVARELIPIYFPEYED